MAAHAHTHRARWARPHGQRGWGQQEGRGQGVPDGGSWQPALVAVGWLPAAVTLTCVFSSSVTPTQT